MTATPKESEKVSNIDYFGEPVYIYSLKQGIEDGFLAPFKVINITTNIGAGDHTRVRPIFLAISLKTEFTTTGIMITPSFSKTVLMRSPERSRNI